MLPSIFRTSMRSTLAAVLGAACLNRICNRRMLSAKFVNGGAAPMRSRDFFVFAASQVKFTPCVLAAIISVLCAANAKASPLTYTESATVSGMVAGDTTNIGKTTGGIYFNNSLTVSVSRSPLKVLVPSGAASFTGVGSGTLTFGEVQDVTNADTGALTLYLLPMILQSPIGPPILTQQRFLKLL